MGRLRASAGPGLSGVSRLLREACTAVAKGVSRSPTFLMRKPVLFPGLSVWTEPSLWVFIDTPLPSDQTHELLLFLSGVRVQSSRPRVKSGCGRAGSSQGLWVGRWALGSPQPRAASRILGWWLLPPPPQLLQPGPPTLTLFLTLPSCICLSLSRTLCPRCTQQVVQVQPILGALAAGSLDTSPDQRCV